MHEPIHQGNRLDLKKINMIETGITKFNVEVILGAPILKDVLHPYRATYIEEFEDEASGELITRGIEINYDKSMRVKEIRRFGFEKKATAQQ
jgi:outer membrane protein assembly factor BamE (lipoprotein component of BamABCDE complex)